MVTSVVEWIAEICEFNFNIVLMILLLFFFIYAIITLLIFWLFELLFFSKRRQFFIILIILYWMVPKSNKGGSFSKALTLYHRCHVAPCAALGCIRRQWRRDESLQDSRSALPTPSGKDRKDTTFIAARTKLKNGRYIGPVLESNTQIPTPSFPLKVIKNQNVS